ncbi:MAG: hypothetical protein HQL49_05500 [Gammaproteobacteria bacterium]|nr:hypothetical protein [Gammaproteobacteria bacterium]
MSRDGIIIIILALLIAVVTEISTPSSLTKKPQLADDQTRLQSGQPSQQVSQSATSCNAGAQQQGLSSAECVAVTP